MHKDDQMTPNERLASFMTGKPMDRIYVEIITNIMYSNIAYSNSFFSSTKLKEE